MGRLNLTPWQRRRLRQQLRSTADARVHRRTLAILEFDQGRPVADIAAILRVTRQAVYNWVAAYCRACDASDLADADHTGRPRLLQDDGTALLRALLGQSPQQLGYPAANWTVALLRERLESGTGQGLSDDTVRRELRRLGYAWKRPRYALAPDPEEEKKTAHLPGNRRAARAQCAAGRGRNRPAALSAAAGVVGAAG